MALTELEKQQLIETITSAVLSSLRTNSQTISELPTVAVVEGGDEFELNDGRRVSFSVIRDSLSGLFETQFDNILTSIANQGKKINGFETSVQALRDAGWEKVFYIDCSYNNANMAYSLTIKDSDAKELIDAVATKDGEYIPVPQRALVILRLSGQAYLAESISVKSRNALELTFLTSYDPITGKFGRYKVTVSADANGRSITFEPLLDKIQQSLEKVTIKMVGSEEELESMIESGHYDKDQLYATPED